MVKRTSQIVAQVSAQLWGLVWGSCGVQGAIAALTVLIFGGWSGVVIGWLLGTASGLLMQRPVADPKMGLRRGVQLGGQLGLWLVGATVFEGLVLRPLTGQFSMGLGPLFLRGLASGGVTVVATGLTMALQGLPLPQRRWAIALTLAFVLVSFPHVDQLAKTGWAAAAVQVLIFMLLALGLNVTVGYAGLLDLGYSAFFAIGAYTTGLLSSPQIQVQWNFWLVIWIAVAIAAVTGFILGSPALRLRGDYLAVVTLGFGEIVPIMLRNLTDIQIYEPVSQWVGALLNKPELALCLVGCSQKFNLTGGEVGINPVGRPALPIVGAFQAGQYIPWYYLILALVVLAVFVGDRLRNSRLGRAWAAIREDELVASTMGVNLVQTKLLAFAVGASFAGFAGAFYAAYISAIFPSLFGFALSVIVLCMVILGGLGNRTGVILGAIIITAADQLYLPQLAKVLKALLNTSVLPGVTNPQLRDFLATSLDPIQMRLFLFGLTLVLMMLLRPEGLVADQTHRAELHEMDSTHSTPAPAGGTP